MKLALKILWHSTVATMGKSGAVKSQAVSKGTPAS